jgi:hypothetical protein
MESHYQLGYFAHSKKDYNTQKESLIYKFICDNFAGHVICPNKHLGELNSIESYLSIVTKTDCVFVTETNGYLGKGAFTECSIALEKGIPVYAIKQNPKGCYFEKVTKVVQTSEYNLFEYGLLESMKIQNDMVN